MYVYKSIYKCLSEPLTLDKDFVLAEKTMDVIKFKIYVLPKNVSVYKIMDNVKNYANLSMVKTECYIYICSNFEIKDDIIFEMEDYVKHNIDNAVLDECIAKVPFIAAIPSPRKAIDLFGNITLHFTEHKSYLSSKEVYCYINHRSKEDQHLICEHNSKIKYVTLNDRHRFNNLHGKVLEDNTVMLFKHYPVNASIVYVLPDEFNVIERTHNKMAFVEKNNFIFWIVTHHTFINNRTYSGEINTTKFCPQQQDLSNIEYIFKVFSDYCFDSPEITKSAIVARDVGCSMLMFVGIYNLQLGNEYVKYFEMLGLK